MQSGTILNVNDNDGTRYLITRLLQRAGYHVIEATTGGQALELVHQHPDLVVLDVKLPDLDGFEVCRRLKGQPALASIKVLQVSALLSSEEYLEEGYACGADGYLPLPFDGAQLVAAVERLLRMPGAS